MAKMTPMQAGMFRAICGPQDQLASRWLAERKWRARTIAAKPQQACDHGLFSDDHLQSDLIALARKDIT